MQLAAGDTSNPMILSRDGIGSPFGQALNTVLRLIRKETTFEEVLMDVKDLLADCDSGHTQMLVMFPEDKEARDLAIQWAFIGPSIFLEIEKLERVVANPSRDDFTRIATIHDLLNTRFMTFIKSGVVSLV